MGDLKSLFHNAVYPDASDLAGAGITGRGTDPNISTGGEGAVDPLWQNPTVPVPGGEETGNSVSGLPAQPNRFEPSETPPALPNLTDRNPGTVDKR
jgi:hypothetical protein